jgi:hypothetical protein
VFSIQAAKNSLKRVTGRFHRKSNTDADADKNKVSKKGDTDTGKSDMGRWIK